MCLFMYHGQRALTLVRQQNEMQCGEGAKENPHWLIVVLLERDGSREEDAESSGGRRLLLLLLLLIGLLFIVLGMRMRLRVDTRCCVA